MSDVLSAILARLESDNPDTVRAASNDLDALFAQHQPEVLRQVKKIVSSPEEAAELTQEAMLVAYGKIGTFRDGERFGAWLWGIARNLAWRANKKRRELLVTDGVMDDSDPVVGVLTRMQRDERQALLERASAQLSEEERAAIQLRYVDGKSRDEIAAALGLSNKSGARGLLQRTHRKLRERLHEELNLAGHGASFFRTR